MSTGLHQRMLVFDHGDRGRADLMREVWAPTPWMVDAFTGDYHDGREREIIEWCYETFGEQASPIHKRQGTWQRGSATVFGWTWFGFATEAQMDQFVGRWPTPPNVRPPA